MTNAYAALGMGLGMGMDNSPFTDYVLIQNSFFEGISQAAMFDYGKL